jgi:hypothetical protein
MSKSLGWIAAISLALCVLFLGLAFAKVGSGFNWPFGFDDGFDEGFVGDKPSAATGDMKQWVWKGDAIEIAVPAEVRVTAPVEGAPPAPATITLRGSSRILDRVRFSNGKLGLIGRINSTRHGDNLEVDISGVFKQYTMAVGELRLGTVKQDKLAIRLQGAGEVRGDGQVNDLDLVISGAGGAALRRLSTKTAHVKISGAASADISPSEAADITLSGIGEVKLHSRPKTLVTHISGLGNVVSPGKGNDQDSDE